MTNTQSEMVVLYKKIEDAQVKFDTIVDATERNNMQNEINRLMSQYIKMKKELIQCS